MGVCCQLRQQFFLPLAMISITRPSLPRSWPAIVKCGEKALI